MYFFFFFCGGKVAEFAYYMVANMISPHERHYKCSPVLLNFHPSKICSIKNS